MNKFDGNRFTIYRHHPAVNHTLKNNYVRTLFEDSRDRFWIGCINGLQRYDRATDRFYDISIARPDGRIDPHITSIVERHNGDLWITTSGQGILSLKNGRTEHDFQVEYELTERIQSNYINVIFEDSAGFLWIATEDKGLFRYSPETDDLQAFTISRNRGYDEVSALCEDEEGNILAGTLTGGLFILRQSDTTGADPAFVTVPYHHGLSLSIRTLLKDQQGRLFVGTDGEGLKIYDLGKNSIEESEMILAPFDFSKAKVHSLIEDKDGNLWLGIFQKGVMMIPDDLHKFQYYGYKSLGRNSIGSGSVMSIFRDKEGTIWVGTDNDGLYAIDEEGNTLKHFNRDPSDATSMPGTIMTIYEDSDHRLWVGSYFHGLAQVDKRTGRCRYVPFVSSGQTTAHEKISWITEDSNKNLWIGTYGAGLHKLNLPTLAITTYESSRNDDNDWSLNLLPNDWISCILPDREGLLWIGTYKGLAYFQPDTQNFINYKGVNNLLPGRVVYYMLEAKNGTIWIGTTEGLICFDKTTETFRHYTTADGLPNEVICGIVEDDQENLWISTHLGLAKFVVREGNFINYYAGDGIQGNEFTRGAVFKDHTGKIYFGGINGITAFYPQDIHEYQKELKVNLTEFYLADHPITQGDKSGKHIITYHSVLESDRFTLQARDHSFSMEFSVMEYVNPERIRYRYRIDELGKDWMLIPPGAHRLTFNNLNHGRYSFHVQAYDQENFSDIRSFRVTILPPWYLTWWAHLIWFLLTATILYFIAMYILTRIRHKQEILRWEHLQQVNEAKLQFFINISHEIRTPMTLIIHPLEKLISEQSEKTSTYLMIYRNAQRILRLINQLMDIRKLDKGQMRLKFRETDMVGFIHDLMQAFDYQAVKNQIEFRFIHPTPELKVWIDLNNFDKVLMNILSNAFKYTPKGGSIHIHLSTGKDETARRALRNYFEITVSDSGIGIDTDKIEEIFERFYQINNDITLSNFGTGIGLHLSRSLVLLHHGTLRAENREDGPGSRFIMRLPLGSDHLRSEELQQPDELLPLSLPREHTDVSLPRPHLTEREEEEEKKIKSRTRYRILVAEDDDEIRQYIRKELHTDFRILECTDGQEAWEIALKEQPDLIVTDVMMPRLDGLSLCRKVKQHTNINHIPVIMLTAKTMQEDHMQGLESGADAYLTKPFRMEMLISTIRNLISNRERLKGKFTGEQQTEEKITKIQMRSADEVLMEKVMHTINTHLSDPALNVEMLAANVGISRVHMHRKLKELTHQSARDFIRTIRLKQAAALLTEKNLTVSEVAYATGFSNLSHFSSSFREFYGMSPTEYKEQPM